MSSGYGMGDLAAEAGAADKVRVQARVKVTSPETVIGTLATRASKAQTADKSGSAVRGRATLETSDLIERCYTPAGWTVRAGDGPFTVGGGCNFHCGRVTVHLTRSSLTHGVRDVRLLQGSPRL